MGVTGQLRAAMVESGLSYYRIAKDTGIPHTSIMRFMLGERDLYGKTIDKLGAYFQMRLTRPVKPKTGG